MRVETSLLAADRAVNVDLEMAGMMIMKIKYRLMYSESEGLRRNQPKKSSQRTISLSLYTRIIYRLSRGRIGVIFDYEGYVG